MDEKLSYYLFETRGELVLVTARSDNEAWILIEQYNQKNGHTRKAVLLDEAIPVKIGAEYIYDA